jgi:hypothetical protein
MCELCAYDGCGTQTLRANLAAQADEKQLELLFLQWTEHHTHLCSFLRLVSFVLLESGCRLSFINAGSCLQKVSP